MLLRAWSCIDVLTHAARCGSRNTCALNAPLTVLLPPRPLQVRYDKVNEFADSIDYGMHVLQDAVL